MEKLLQSVFNGISVGICIIDLDGRVLQVNPSLRELLGYGLNTQIPETYEELLFQDDVPAVWKILEGLRDGKSNSTPYQIRFRSASHEILKVALRAFYEKGGDGIPECYICEMKELSPPSGAENLSQADQQPDVFAVLAGGITHSFNNILSSILGNAEYALRYELSKEAPGTYSIQQIIKASHRASSLTRQILTLSRWKKSESSGINLNPIIKEVAKFLNSSTPAYIAIRLSLKASSDFVKADPVYIHKILMTLCTHGIAAMHLHGGTLEIHLRDGSSLLDEKTDVSHKDAPSSVELCVGVILAENSAQHQEPVFTLNPAEGNLSGLDTVCQLVQKMSGETRISNKAGKGSCFSAFLPVYDSGTRGSVISKKPITGGRERILFVDDEEQIVEFVERAMGAMGYTITGKNSSIDAYETFCRSPEAFDILISDMNMDEMTGDKLAEKVLKIRSDIPVIICTGYDEMLVQERVDEIGIDAVILKPFMMDKMDELIRWVLAGKPEKQ